MKRLLNLALKSTGLKQSVFTIGGNFLSTGISAIAVILISRFLGPEKFGQFNVGFAIVLILIKINDGGMSTAILKYAAGAKSKDQQNDIFNYTFTIKLIISTIIMVLGIIFYQPLSQILNFSQPQIILAAFTIGLATTYYEHLLAMLQSLHRFTQAVVINTIQAITKLAGALILVFTTLGSVSTVFGWYILAPLMPVLLYKFLLPSWVKIKLSLESKSKAKIVSLAQHSAVALLTAGIIENIDVLFVQRFLDDFETGLYSGVSKIAMIVAMFAYSLGSVLNPRVAKYKSKNHISAFIKKSMLVVLAAAIGFAVFIPFSKLSIYLTVGPEYLSGNLPLLILTAGSFLAIASMPFIALFYSFNKNWYFSLSGILQLAIIVGGNLIFVPQHGLMAAAWTKFATRLFLFLFTFTSALLIYKRQYGKVAS